MNAKTDCQDSMRRVLCLNMLCAVFDTMNVKTDCQDFKCDVQRLNVFCAAFECFLCSISQNECED